jgi:AcrR family transcriptional regulator
MPAAPRPTRPRREPITVDRILAIAFEIVRTEGFDALTMRRVATVLDTGPASLYAHVRNKAELDDLMIGTLAGQITIPVADPARWRAQFADVCRQIRDRYVAFPGISRAALEASPTTLDTLRLSEGMLSILLAGGVAPQSATWAIDAAYLYVAAYSLELSLHHDASTDADDRLTERDATVERFEALPADEFPNTIRYARELTSGAAHDRFDFTIELLLRGL